MQNQPQGQRGKRLGTLKNGNQPCNIRSLPRCKAKAKSTGQQCGNIAVKGKRVCYIHGGKSTGPGKLNQNAVSHGFYTQKAKQERRQVQKSIQEMNQLLEDLLDIGDLK